MAAMTSVTDSPVDEPTSTPVQPISFQTETENLNSGAVEPISTASNQQNNSAASGAGATTTALVREDFEISTNLRSYIYRHAGWLRHKDRRHALCPHCSTIIPCSNSSTTGCWAHLKKYHQEEFHKAMEGQRTQQESGEAGTAVKKTPKKANKGIKGKLTPAKGYQKSDTKQLRSFEEYETDKDRLLALHYAKTHVVLGLEPFDFMENEERRTLLETMLPAKSEDKPFKAGKLNAKMMKKCIVEMYSATRKTFSARLAQEIGTSPIRILHVSIDLWTAKACRVHKEKFMGMRVFYLTEEFKVESHLLAVKQFAPRADMDSEKAASLVQLWAEHTLKEFGLNWSMVAGATIDGDSDIRCALSNLPGIKRECCVARMLDRAIVEAFGLSVSPATSKNLPARKSIHEVKEIVECLRKSRTAKGKFDDLHEDKHGDVVTSGLRQAAPCRWIASTAVLERFLALHNDVAAHYTEHEKRRMNIVEKEVHEIYSMMKSMALIIRASQPNAEISCVPTMQRMILLLQYELNMDRPLELHEPSHYYIPSAEQGSEAAPPTARVTKSHWELSGPGQNTRVQAHGAVFKRFGMERWGPRYEGETHHFDMALALNPSCRDQKYIASFAPSIVVANKVKDKVWNDLTKLVEEVIVFQRASRSRETEAHEQVQKRLKSAPASDEGRVNKMVSAGVFDDDSDENDEEELVKLRAAADAKIREWRAAKFPRVYRHIDTGDGLGAFWNSYGKCTFPELSVVARSVLGAQATAAVLENDFGEAGKLVNLQSATLGSAYTEMIMFLRGNYDHIPASIPKLGDTIFEDAIPTRLRSVATRAKLAGLCAASPVVDETETRHGKSTLRLVDGDSDSE